ncbi:hypothetical protein BDV39DRAFT_178880 [Aspergillus sergii]|uniref:Uncharacterized protein n=1 Tax=Aspergillus sergii TaxID=1034303 RepID=A0A5N6WX21_9EURO|nr:hypothetical protein BDV39DRAFT_178880 [Aspergillus sergii]
MYVRRRSSIHAGRKPTMKIGEPVPLLKRAIIVIFRSGRWCRCSYDFVNPLKSDFHKVGVYRSPRWNIRLFLGGLFVFYPGASVLWGQTA